MPWEKLHYAKYFFFSKFTGSEGGLYCLVETSAETAARWLERKMYSLYMTVQIKKTVDTLTGKNQIGKAYSHRYLNFPIYKKVYFALIA